VPICVECPRCLGEATADWNHAVDRAEMSTYITSMGRFLPWEPVDNESMEEYLGKINGKPSWARARILKTERH
jgi:hypothetical protein